MFRHSSRKPRVVPQVIPQAIPQTAPPAIPQTAPQVPEKPHTAPQAITQTAPQYIPPTASQMPAVVPPVVPQVIPQAIPQTAPPDMPQTASQAPEVELERIKEHDSMQVRDVTFTIEDRRFRVPIQMFSESKSFCAMLERAATKDPDAKQAINLDGFSKDDFLYFLRFIYQRQLGAQLAIDLARYTALLKLSTKWRFDTVRAAVIRDFPDVDVVDKIILARDHGVHEWFVASLNKFAQLGRSITLQDVQRLGTNYILKFTQIREKFLQGGSSFASEVYQRCKYDFRTSLADLFGEEIKQSSFQLPPVTQSAVEDFNLVDMFFLVENHLFKSYRQCFEDSPIFRTMFSLPVGENNIQDGATKSQPLRLEGVVKSDFTPFVELINPIGISKLDFSLAEWVSILKLSVMWEFTRIHQYAITQIQKLKVPSPVMQIKLSRDYGIQEWFLLGLTAYAQQASPITVDDIDSLGWEFVLKLLQARERMGNFTSTIWGSYDPAAVWYIPGIEARVTHDFTQAIETTFRDEIERIRQMYAG